ncbi:baseplate multidomain protein megatron [Microvirga mediterraneensis]|uniref:Glycoside hydrolase/phage tail family protein n=1 Tax=Microvirga mediterraneensis TaxID=2754695 RepID=A0A838BUB8_9HYPH|nr:glycoside hydrolase/phage tail family protein [Microvirga mediterraneensis]MBA1158046.1 glycoside hydrolase/phage tail family protein [Microvirga mediterraneensis]
MATIVLQTVGAAVGGMVGGPIGAMAGRALGALAGAAIDNALFSGDSTKHVEGPRLKDIDGLTSTEGAPIPRVYGRARIGGQLIWATRLEEVASTDRSSQGGKGIGGPKTSTTTYSYFANLAVGLCEGRIAFIRRVWADGRELDLSTITMRVHTGSETQNADPLIVAKEGAQNAPAYRGLAYVVFERLPLADFGNRVPQFSFEVVRPVDGLNRMIRAVCLIPGASEFGYDTLPVTQVLDLGKTRPENRHQMQRDTDVAASLDAMQALCPNLKRVSLVVSWFGDDLRAGSCLVEPRVDVKTKANDGATWSVAGVTRADAKAVSLVNGSPAYGGTPSDESVKRLIRNLKARGLQVVLYPFVMMDVPAGNELPDPYGGTGQPPYPWRGRITCHPAPGKSGSPDGTAAAATQVEQWFTRSEGFNRMVLHYAELAEQAGGVHGFVLGSELVGLTRVRSASGVYPAVTRLKALAGQVRDILRSSTKIVYAADWTEYGAHILDSGGEVRFPLDPLFASDDIDAVGIDYYPPISDWRDGPNHADLSAARNIYDVDYLRARLGSGEAFDWYYANASERAVQTRRPITDGAHGKPWIFRAKDLVSWWSNRHVERVNGVETGATSWQPQSKPIWLTEIGVPAVDKGPNGPNVFPDPKSSESAYPPFSRGVRDDLVQARTLEAILSRFDPAQRGFLAEYNPPSSSYDGRMVDPDSVFVWAWDARPYPAFPDFDNVWADGRNWETGHWITGRIEGATLDRLIARILRDFGFSDPGAIPIDGFVDGYVIDRPMSVRGAVEPLLRLFGVDAVARGGGIAWQGRGGRAVVHLTKDDLVLDDKEPSLKLTRAQETELPQQVEVGFIEGDTDYRRATVASRRLSGSSRREARADSAVITRRAEAQRLADTWLQDLWAGREGAEFELSPRRMELEPGDVIAVPTDAGEKLHRITRIADGPTRKISTRAVEPAVFERPGLSLERPVRRPPPVPGKPAVVVLDLPAALGDPAPLQYVAVAADPWPSAMTVWRSGNGTSFTPLRVLDLPAVIGRTKTALMPGPLWRWDPSAVLDVEISSGALSAIDDEAALGGRNLFALQGPDGRWEIFSAARAEMIGERVYRLTRFLRGLAGSEPEAGRAVPAGSLLVKLDEAVVPLTTSLQDLGSTWRYRIGPSGRDHGDPAVTEVVATVGRDALKPFSPVQVSARREPGGIRLEWVRRARRNGDAWDAIEVPLDEDAERYEIDILKGGAVVRTLTSTQPFLVYGNADEMADFGGLQSTLTLRIAQVSAVAGRGFERHATVAVR